MFSQEERKARATRRLAAAIVALSPLFLADLSYAAGRVFYDGFESGNTNLWGQDDYHNRCQVVASAVDQIAGPYAGSLMARCNDNGTVADNAPEQLETLVKRGLSYTNEIFYRAHFRIGQDMTRTVGSCKKFLRIYTGANNDIYSCVTPGTGGVRSEGQAGGRQMETYWGDLPGDHTSNSSGWHTIEYYFNSATGRVRTWHDGVMIRDITVSPGFGGTLWTPFYLQSNFGDPHDATNHIYYDDIEVFSDTASGASGSMADASVSASASASAAPAAPTNVDVR